MRILLASLAAVVLLPLAALAETPPGGSISIDFGAVEFVVADPGSTDLAAGKYGLRSDRTRFEPGDRIELRLVGQGVVQPRTVVIPALTLIGCGRLVEGETVAFGAGSATRVTAQADGGLSVRVAALANRRCSFSFVIPPAPAAPRTVQRPTGAGGLVTEVEPPRAPPRQPPDSGSPQPNEPPPPPHATTLVGAGGPPPPPPPPPPRPTGPGGMTLGRRPPQCAPTTPPHDSGSPQPSLLELGLAATPLSPPDAECDMTAIPSFSELQGISTRVEPAESRGLLSALTALRRNVERLALVRPEDQREVMVARGRIRQSLAEVSRASRSGTLAEVAARCEGNFARCDSSCGDRECCCCLASYMSCLAE